MGSGIRGAATDATRTTSMGSIGISFEEVRRGRMSLAADDDRGATLIKLEAGRLSPELVEESGLIACARFPSRFSVSGIMLGMYSAFKLGELFVNVVDLGTAEAVK